MPQGKSFWVRITQSLSFQIASYYYYDSVKNLPKTEVVKYSYFASASHRKKKHIQKILPLMSQKM